jgi:hypothetical protein
MKRSLGSTAWVQEAAGQTNSEAFVVRDPKSDTAHVISFPSGVPTIMSAPAFAPAVIRSGEWPAADGAYKSAGIGKDGTLVLKDIYDRYSSGIATKDTETVWASGKWGGSAWSFNPVVRQYIGERHCYSYVLPGAFGIGSEFVDVSERDVRKEVAGLPNLNTNYAWDGVRLHRSSVTSTSGWGTVDIMPKRTEPSTTTTSAAFMYFMDVLADSKGRLLTLHRVSDPAGGPSGTFLTVNDGAGNRLYQAPLSYQSGNPRMFEDGKGRLWVLVQGWGSSGADMRLFRLNDDFTLGTMTNLSSSFSGFPYEGMGRIAATRGGNVIGNTVSGSYNNGSQVVAWSIRLPD